MNVPYIDELDSLPRNGSYAWNGGFRLPDGTEGRYFHYRLWPVTKTHLDPEFLSLSNLSFDADVGTARFIWYEQPNENFEPYLTGEFDTPYVWFETNIDYDVVWFDGDDVLGGFRVRHTKDDEMVVVEETPKGFRPAWLDEATDVD